MCIRDRKWMLSIYLKLNDDKTEFLIISSKRSKRLTHTSLQIGNCAIESVESANNLGVMFDKFMSMDQFISQKCKSAMFAIRSLSKIRRYLDMDTTRTLVQALVTSQLDYANSALYGLPKKSLHRLQLVQNTAARLVTRTPRRHHITPILYDLHWLPIEQRIRYKILVICFKGLQGLSLIHI